MKMSVALSTQPDRENSTFSNGTHPDLSLGSLTSGFSTPARNIRAPSSSSHTTAQSSAPIATPSPPATFTRRKTEDGAALARRLGNLSHYDEEIQEEGDLLDTPGAEKKRWGDVPETPVATRPKRTRASVGATTGGTKASALTLRDQEKVGGHLLCIVLLIYLQSIIRNTNNTCSCSTSTTSKRRTSTSSCEYIFWRNGWHRLLRTRQRQR